jgi:hypothetical protein
MTTFLVGAELRKEIEDVLSEEGCRCAVAFWGAGSAAKLHGKGTGNFKLVCNLASGGTNPFEIEKLKRGNVRQCDALHAKVYLGSIRAVITSANVSANGLGLEGIEQARWIEAGVLVHDTAEISKWFDALWEKSGRIEDPHLAHAKDAWKLRQRAKPSLQSIADLDVEKGKTPLLYWLGDSDWKYNKKSIKEYFGNVTNGNLSLIDDGLEAETPLDRHSPDKCRLKTTLRLFAGIGKPGSPRTRLRRV